MTPHHRRSNQEKSKRSGDAPARSQCEASRKETCLLTSFIVRLLSHIDIRGNEAAPALACARRSVRAACPPQMGWRSPLERRCKVSAVAVACVDLGQVSRAYGPPCWGRIPAFSWRTQSLPNACAPPHFGFLPTPLAGLSVIKVPLVVLC